MLKTTLNKILICRLSRKLKTIYFVRNYIRSSEFCNEAGLMKIFRALVYFWNLITIMCLLYILCHMLEPVVELVAGACGSFLLWCLLLLIL